MKVLFLLYRYPGYGGIETVTTVLANYLSAQGVDVSILSLRQENSELLGNLSRNTKVYQLPTNNNLLDIENQKFVVLFLNAHHFDFIINQESYFGMLDLLSKVSHGLKWQSIILTVEHNSPDASHRLCIQSLAEKKRRSLRGVVTSIISPWILSKSWRKEVVKHKKYFKQSDGYILLSEHFFPILSKMLNLKRRNNIWAIENPTTIKRIPFSLTEKEKIVLYVGRMDDYGQKRVDRLIKIWEKIWFESKDWQLVIVGDGPQRRVLEEYVNANGVRNISFEGLIQNVEFYYAKASILCLTSSVEGWGLVLTESMSYGCIPIAYNSFVSARDIIDSDVNGILVTPFDESEFIQALKKIMINTTLRTKMAEAAIEKAESFDIHVIGNKWMDLLTHYSRSNVGTL